MDLKDLLEYKPAEQALLPVEKIQRRVRDLQIGETGWIYPTFMEVDPERLCWIRLDCFIEEEQGNDRYLKITRDEAGFCVQVFDPETRWGILEDDHPVLRQLEIDQGRVLPVISLEWVEKEDDERLQD